MAENSSGNVTGGEQPRAGLSVSDSTDIFDEEGVIDLGAYWRTLLPRWRIIALVTALVGVLFLSAAFVVTPTYRAATLLTPADDEQASRYSSLMNQVGGFASLFGFSSGGSSSIHESVAILKSRSFIDAFIREEGLMPVLFASRWDAENNTWKDDDPDAIPTADDAYFLFARKIYSVSLDKQTRLVTIVIEWSDPQLVAEWANKLVVRLNRYQQMAAIREAGKSIEYLKEQLEKTSVVEMRESIFKLIEAQTKQMMLANVREEFVFKVIDAAVAPDANKPVKPKKLSWLLLGMLIGFVSVVIVILYRSGQDEVRQDGV